MWSSIFQRKADDAFQQAMSTGDLRARARWLRLAAYHLRMVDWPVVREPMAELSRGA